jgi:HK97 family phage prohead protease
MAQTTGNTISREAAAAERKTALLRGKTEDRHGMHLARGTAPIDVDTRRVLTFPLHMQPVSRADEAPRELVTFPGTAAIRSAPVKTARAEDDDPDKDEDDKHETTRSDDDDKDDDDDKESFWCHLSGVASVVETPYSMWDIFGPYEERVSVRAFDASLSRGPDVAFLANHTGLTMARTRAGTLMLSAIPQGLAIETWANRQRNDVHDLAIAIAEGSIDQMSFAAFLEEGEWNEDFTEFTILRLDLDCGDVSAVNFGANPNTSIAHRAHRFLEQIDQLPDRAAREAYRMLEARYGSLEKNETKQAAGRSLALVRSALLAGE